MNSRILVSRKPGTPDYRFELVDESGATVFISRPYTSLAETRVAAQRFKENASSAFLDEQPVAALDALEAETQEEPPYLADVESEKSGTRQDAGDGDAQRATGEYKLKMKFSGEQNIPINYKASGVELAYLQALLADIAETFSAANDLVLLSLKELQGPDVDDSGSQAGLLYEAPRVRLRAGSLWVDLLSEYGSVAAVSLSLMGAVLRGPQALATLPSKTRAAYYNGKADAVEARQRLLIAERTLREERGLQRALPTVAADLGNLVGPDDQSGLNRHLKGRGPYSHLN